MTQRKNRHNTEPKTASVAPPDIQRLEFHRNAYALIPSADDPRPGVASMVIRPGSISDQRHCTCQSKSRTCPHLKQLAALQKSLQDRIPGANPETGLKSSFWCRLAQFMGDGGSETPASVQMDKVFNNGKSAVVVKGAKGAPLATYLSNGSDRLRFIQRCGPPPEDPDMVYTGKVLDELTMLTLSATEREMLNHGYKTRGLAFEQSFWFRLAYHGYREFGPSGLFLRPQIDEEDGAFTVLVQDECTGPVFRLIIPRKRVARFLDKFKDRFDPDDGFCPEPVPVDAIFDVRINKELDLELLPRIRVVQKNGDFAFFGRKDLKKFEYGDLQYIPELGLLTHMELPDNLVKQHRGSIMTVIDRARVPAFVEAFGNDLHNGRHRIDAGLQGLKVLATLDRVDMEPLSWDAKGIEVSVHYRFASQSVPLSEIIQARNKGQRFIATADGWVDCQSQDLDGLDALADFPALNLSEQRSETFTASLADLLRIRASVDRIPKITGSPERRKRLEQMFDLTSPALLPDLTGRTSPLRPYQLLGVQWLWYLFTNGFGGLLCDDMGLGKTHQVMALMACLEKEKRGAFLVVCPTTVLSHWEKKIRAHTPGLQTGIYHGSDRDLEQRLAQCRVLLTSYGILRRDAQALGNIDFTLAVFDEVQYLKNTGTQAHAAATAIQADMKIGLTGTPIENSVRELKGLMDLVMPGYLGSEGLFTRRYVRPIEEENDIFCRKELGRIIAPFVLRRMKNSVLEELPAKIEDIRTCTLAPDQHRLYNQALEERRQGLLDKLRIPHGAVPYIHIFALLNRLKQICDHPALILGDPEGYENHGSGKWSLFVELLTESLESGQKVVVYSQYLTMINIIARHLKSVGIDAAVLTGASRNRGAIIDRFNTDPDCRVFVGSLMAGGTGIDLIAASVVIHYDRWWNAAREDQATDRVHRIGQRRGVQVFKLVTEETVEERISEIIGRKKALMESVVEEDDPGTLKFFTREELIEMLALPSRYNEDPK
ncbi:MAG: DEAD/DEAH box helicase [Desulfobacterales bacterium]|nr:DEAD/DEAH box helicase [Desulfobacterales bacterium]